MIGDDESNSPHKLLLTNKQVANLRKAFANYLSTDIKLSKIQISKMIQSGGFLDRLFGPLLKTGSSLIKKVIKALAKSVLITLGLTAASPAADAEVYKNIVGSGKRPLESTLHIATLITSNDEMEDIIKMVKFLEDSSLLWKGISQTVQNEATEQKGGFLSMLLGTLDTSLLGNIIEGKGINRAAEGVIRTGYGNKNKMDF